MDFRATVCAHAVPGTVIRTLADAKPNTIRTIDEQGLWVQTLTGTKAELVPWRMLEEAWYQLSENGYVRNAELLRVRGMGRSSFVCALFATFSEVQVVSRKPIELRLATARTKAA